MTKPRALALTRTLTAAAVLGWTTGCMRQPVLVANPSLDTASAERDVASCSDQAGSGLRVAGSEALVATLVSALSGAAGGAVAGAIWGNPGAGAASGAAGGAVGALVNWAIRPHQPDPEYVAAVERCLRDRGHQIARWE